MNLARQNLLKTVLVAGALAAAACDTSSALDTAPTELRAPGNGPPAGPTVNVARGGIPDDSIRPAPTVNVAKAGTADDGVKPAPGIGKAGTADDGVKPVPEIAKAGTVDEGVKPVSSGGKVPSSPGGRKPVPPKPATTH
ncbi:MAG: hypothetical protein OZ921_12445 [Sorangiineae bacterium]|nr:hypothetical protein [Polyangiaceae bacterium]MEB2323316.1 hypothetical protein [Sorangiineae bacterium]